jgi:DNA-binding transcriptional regulator YdaS (Cro superfamily)
MTRLLCVIVCLVGSAVFNGVLGATTIQANPLNPDIGERVNISCTGGSDINPLHNELQWRRSTDEVTNVQNAQKIIDTDLNATRRTWDPAIDKSRFDISKNENVPPDYFFTIKRFAPSDVYKYWCRFFKVPAIVEDEIASVWINTRVPPNVDQMAIIHSGIQYSHGSTIESVEDGDEIVCEVNGTRPAVNISWEAPGVELTPGETIYTPNPDDGDLIDAKRNATVDKLEKSAKVTCIADNKQGTDPVQISVTITKPGNHMHIHCTIDQWTVSRRHLSAHCWLARKVPVV